VDEKRRALVRVDLCGTQETAYLIVEDARERRKGYEQWFAALGLRGFLASEAADALARIRQLPSGYTIAEVELRA